MGGRWVRSMRADGGQDRTADDGMADLDRCCGVQVGVEDAQRVEVGRVVPADLRRRGLSTTNEKDKQQEREGGRRDDRGGYCAVAGGMAWAWRAAARPRPPPPAARRHSNRHATRLAVWSKWRTRPARACVVCVVCAQRRQSCTAPRPRPQAGTAARYFSRAPLTSTAHSTDTNPHPHTRSLAPTHLEGADEAGNLLRLDQLVGAAARVVARWGRGSSSSGGGAVAAADRVPALEASGPRQRHRARVAAPSALHGARIGVRGRRACGQRPRCRRRPATGDCRLPQQPPRSRKAPRTPPKKRSHGGGSRQGFGDFLTKPPALLVGAVWAAGVCGGRIGVQRWEAGAGAAHPLGNRRRESAHRAPPT